MVIDFENSERQKLENFKGGEKYVDAVLLSDENNKIMLGTLIPGATIGMHRHEGSSEVIYITKGDATVIYDGKKEHLTAGMCHYCEEGHEHSLRNDSDCDVEYFAVVPTHR